jgi:hypothetical protein
MRKKKPIKPRYRKHDQCWYITWQWGGERHGRRVGLRYEDGSKIKGKRSKAKAETAYQRLCDLPTDEDRQRLYEFRAYQFPQPDDSGFVYFIADERKHWVKIGRAKNPKARLRDLQTSCPLKLFLLAKVFNDSAPKAESELHERFDKYRHRGEWFWLEGKLLDYVKEIKA